MQTLDQEKRTGYKQLLNEYYETQRNLEEMLPYEKEVAEALVDVFLDTELPQSFEVFETGSTGNNNVKRKYTSIHEQIPSVLLFPYELGFQEGLEFADDRIRIEPWVNMVHGWMRVLNYLNTVAAMQRGDEEFDPSMFSLMARKLCRNIVESHGESELRSWDDLVHKGVYKETKFRRNGTSENLYRYMNKEETFFILDRVKDQFSKRAREGSGVEL